MNDLPNSSGPVLPDSVARRMQAIIERHSQEYRRDLPGLIESMSAHAAQMRDPRARHEAMPLLKREAHDMKGQAVTFGLPALSIISQSLCRLLEYGDREHPEFAEVVELHVSALSRLMAKDDPAEVERIQSEAARLGGDRE